MLERCGAQCGNDTAAVSDTDTDAATVRDLIADLSARDGWHAAAFADLTAIRCAVDQQLADLDAPLKGAREVAFFPPMTGG